MSIKKDDWLLYVRIIVWVVVVFSLLQIPFIISEKKIAQTRDVSILLHQSEDVSVHQGSLSLVEDDRLLNEAHWISWRTWREQHGEEHYTGEIWFKIPLPENEWVNPQLFTRFNENIEIYLDTEKIYAYNSAGSNQMVSSYNWNLSSLGADFTGKTLLIRMYFEHEKVEIAYLRLGENSDQLIMIFLSDLTKIFFSSIFLFISIASFLFYLSNSKEKSYLFLALFVLIIAFTAFVRTYVSQLYFDIPIVYYFQQLILPLAALTYSLYFSGIFGERYRRIHRIIWISMLLLSVCSLIAGAIDKRLFDFFTGPIFLIVYFLSLILTLFICIDSFVKHKNVESIWFLVGIGVAGFFILINVIVFISEHLLNKISFVIYCFHFNERFLIGIFILIFTMIMVMRERMLKVYLREREIAKEIEIKNRELEELTHSLEEQVYERTSHLQEANAQLRQSMYETSTALAEVSVLEERNRIAQDIHNNVGHTLTTTIVQLEAVKRLFNKDPDVAIDKLNVSQQLVRKGLQQIRKSVHLMKEEEVKEGFIQLIMNLIQDTEEATGIRVEYFLEELPILNSLQKQVLYQALQEGLTNGIRHGKSKNFNLIISYQFGKINFHLSNIGKLYEKGKLGFGLQSMKREVEKLGGSFYISNFEQQGCLLSIELPILIHN